MSKIKNYSFLLFIIFLSCKAKPGQLLKIINIPNYPSASGLAGNKNSIYLAGDDAATIWVLDTSYNKISQINLYASSLKRISKDEKEDLEALTLLQKDDAAFLFAAGSGSTINREQGWLINLKDLQKNKFSLSVFYKRLKLAGIKDVNIEGITATEQGFILANRGHLGYRMNHLIFTSSDFYKNQELAPITLVKFGFQKDSSFSGISGLSYSAKTGHLYGTLSTEQTSSSFADGAIGHSLVFILKDVMQKQRLAAVNANTLINLSEINDRLKNQKIESLFLLNEDIKLVKLLLAADNDDGKSTLFEVEIKP